jgi:hypothetical protein
MDRQRCNHQAAGAARESTLDRDGGARCANAIWIGSRNGQRFD